MARSGFTDAARLAARWRKALVASLLLPLFVTTIGAAPQRPSKRQLDELYMRTQGRTDGRDIVYYISGFVYSFIPGQRPQKLFGMEGYNIRRLIPTPERDGFFVATREIVFYTDPQTGQVLSTWKNPFTGQINEVFHVANDPVNQRIRVREDGLRYVSLDGKQDRGAIQPPREWEQFYVWTSDVFPFYSLPGWSRNYTAAEMFDFYVPKSALAGDGTPDVMVSWTRVGPWLPWMGMDGREGQLVYHAQSKLLPSWEELPPWMKDLVRERYPLYMSAPERVDPARPNATSWNVYRAEMEKRRKTPAVNQRRN